MSSAMLSELCSGFKLDFSVFLPSRLEHGYGLNKTSIEAFKASLKAPPDLLIMTDCGSNNYKEIEELKKFGIKNIIIIDHHIVGDAISSNANALINWRMNKHEEMCSCGQVYQFIRGLRRFTKKVNPIEFLTYAAIGTVGDMSPIVGSNRIIVRHGLQGYSIDHVSADGLNAMMGKSYINTQDLTQEEVAFKIVPQINAAGRISLPNISYDLLIEHDHAKAELMEDQLVEHNTNRKKIQKKIADQAIAMVKKNIQDYKHGIFVCAPNWHIGVVGIIASKLVEEFNRPSIVIGKHKDIWKGSGRSIEGISLKDILDSMPEDSFAAYGGHDGAVGVTVGTNTPSIEINKAFNKACKVKYKEQSFPDDLNYYNAELKIGSVNIDTAKLLMENLYPYGEDNPAPVFLVKDVVVSEANLREGEGWSLITFAIAKGGETAGLKMKMFNPKFGTEVSGTTCDIYFKFPQNVSKNKFGLPQLEVIDVNIKK